MRIPVFVSCPTVLSDVQNEARSLILKELDKNGLESRAVGRSDYPTDLPLREVLRLARHCSGGVVLGFEQFWAEQGTSKRGSIAAQSIESPLPFPTPWNHLESGIMYALGVPLLVFREPGISGGVFDHGTTEVFVHPMPTPKISRQDKEALSQVFLKWQASVRNFYYGV